MAQIYELRTCTAADGKLDALAQRFRRYTLTLLARHGMTNLGYWQPSGASGRPARQIVYLLAHQDRATADASWTAFRADPAWHRVRDASEAEGPLVEDVVSVYLDPFDFSPLQ